MEELDPPTQGRLSTLTSLHREIENFIDGMTDDGWKHLDDNLIDSCYRAPPKWIPLLKRITVAADYI